MKTNGGKTLVIRPKFGERSARVRELFRTRIKITREPVEYKKGERDLHGDPLLETMEISEGAVLVPIWNDNPRPQDYIYRDIYEAIRGQEYTSDGYQAPAGEINSLRMSADAAHSAIRLFLDYGNLTRDKRGFLKSLLFGLSIKHGGSRNPEKKEAARKFEMASEEADSLGRPNPGARAARTVAGGNRLELRREQVAALVQAIGPRRTALLSELDRLWTDGWLLVWREIKNAEEALDASVCQRSGNGIPRRLTHALDAAESALETIDVEPFLSGRFMVASELASARSNVLRHRWNRAREDLLRSQECIRFKKAGRRLHEIILDLSLYTANRKADGTVVPLNDAIGIRNALGDFRERFEPLSEKHLRRPIKAEVETLVGAAQDELLNRATFSRLEKAKEYLKGALAYL